MTTVAEGHELAGRYVVGRQLGAGGSGSVWRARDTVLDRTVAVKVVPDGEAAARLAREARATAGIGVPNVVGVYDVGRQDDVHFLVMEFVDGTDLATMLRTTGPLEPDVAALVGRDVARGVAAVHDADLVHRDVTPANVLVTVEGAVKLTDLGIAQRADDDDATRLTQVGTVVGTVDYLAPEQVEDGDVSGASDVYAVGLLLHTLCTGRRPFGDGPVAERIARRLTSSPPPLDGSTGRLADVVARATERDPAARYRDGRVLQEALAPLVPDDEDSLRRRLADRVARVASDAPQPAAEPPSATVTGTGPAAGTGTSVLADGDLVPPDQPADGGGGPPSTDATTMLPVGAGEGGAGGAATADGHRSPPLGSVVLMVVGVGVAVAAAAVLLTGGSGGGGDGDGGGTATPVTIAAVDDHDPLGGGDEHGDEVGRVADGDPDTAWDTEGYETAALSGLKTGVGILLDLGEATDVTAVEVDLGLDGVDLAVAVSPERPSGDPTAEASVLGTVQDGSGTVRVEGDAASGRWVAVWFTGLAPDGDDFRAEVAEVRVFGP